MATSPTSAGAAQPRVREGSGWIPSYIGMILLAWSHVATQAQMPTCDTSVEQIFIDVTAQGTWCGDTCCIGTSGRPACYYSLRQSQDEIEECQLPIDCPTHVLANGVVNASCSGQSRGYCGQEACHAGFELSGAGTTAHYCMASGSWYPGDFKTCVPVTCPALLAPTHGSISGGCGGDYDDACVFGCDAGWVLSAPSDAVKTCQQNGAWSGLATLPTCRPVDCGAISLANGATSGTCDGSFGESCTYAFCNTGWELSAAGDTSQTCQQSEIWSGSAKTCDDIDACVDNPCDVNAVSCLDSDAPAPNTAAGRVCQGCNTGYSGDGTTCEDIDACVAHPCSALATCTDLEAPALNSAAGRTCSSCPVGYSGDGSTCSNIDACATAPCDSNAASCTDVVGGATDATGRTCNGCNVGYEGSGDTCSDIDACIEYPCSAFSSPACDDALGPAPNAASGRTCGTCDAGYNGNGELCVLDAAFNTQISCFDGSAYPEVVRGESVTVEVQIYLPSESSEFRVDIGLDSAVENATVTAGSIGDNLNSADLDSPTISGLGTTSVAIVFGAVSTSSLSSPGLQDSFVLSISFVVPETGSIPTTLSTTVTPSFATITGAGTASKTLTDILTVIDPVLTVTSSVSPSGVPVLEADDQLTFTVVTTRNQVRTYAAGAAYELDLTVGIPTYLELVSSVCSSSCTGLSETDDSATMTAQLPTLPVTDDLIMVYTMRLVATVPPGVVIAGPSVALTYKGLPDSSSASTCVRTGTLRSISSPAVATVARAAGPTGSVVLQSVSHGGGGNTVTVGGTIQWSAEMTLPEGRSSLNFRCTFPGPSDRFMTDATTTLSIYGSAVTAVGGGTPVITVSPDTDSNGRVSEVVVGFTTSLDVGPSASAADKTITLLIGATVDNVAGLSTLPTFTLAVVVDYGANSLSLSSPTVTIVEPGLRFSSPVAVVGSDVAGGDTLSVSAVVSHSGSSTGDASDVKIIQSFSTWALDPSTLSSSGATSLCSPACSVNMTIEETTTGVEFLLPALALGQTWTMTWMLTVTPSTQIPPNSEFGLAHTAAWSSAPVATGHAEDFTVVGASASINTAPVTLSMALTGTNISSTADNLVTVGEAATFEVTIVIPATTTTLSLTVVADNALAHTVPIVLAAYDANIATLTGTSVSTDAATDQMFTTTATVANSNSIFLVLTVQTDVLASAVVGATAPVTATLVYGSNPGSADPTTTVTASQTLSIVAPTLTAALVNSDGAVSDAGDPFTLGLEVTHEAASVADAYDVEVTYALAPGVVIDTSAVAIGCVFLESTSIGGPLTASECSDAGGTSSSGSGSNSSVSFTLLGLPTGFKFQTGIGAIFDNTVATRDTLVSTVTYAYSSYSGGFGDNRYSAQLSQSKTVSADPQIEVTLQAASGAIGTTGTFRVHEEFTFITSVTLAEGSNSMRLAIAIPSGLTIVTSTIADIGANVAIGGLSSGDVLVDANSGSDLLFNFGTVLDTFDNSATSDDMFTVLVTARLDDSTDNNVGGAPHSLVATLDFGSAYQYNVDATATYTNVEPELTIDSYARVAFSGDGAIDAGDVLSFNASISHHVTDSSSEAYQLRAAFDLPSEIIVASAADIGVTVSCCDLASSVDVVFTDGNTFTVTLPEAPPGAEIHVTYSATVSQDARYAQDLTSNLALSWSSASSPRAGRVETASASISVSTKTITGPTIMVIGTSLDDTTGTDVVVGEDVRYHVTVTLAELSMDASIAVTLPSGLTVVSSHVVAVGGSIANQALIVDANASVAGDIATFSFGELDNIADNAADSSDEITVAVVAQVVSAISSNTRGATLTATATLTIDSGTLSATAAVTIVSAELEVISVDLDPSTAVDGGDTVTCTAVLAPSTLSNAVAYDIVLTAIIPGTLQATRVTVGMSDSTMAAQQVTWNLAQLGDTYTVSFEAQVLNTMRPHRTADANCTVGVTYNTVPSGGQSFAPATVESASLVLKDATLLFETVATSLADTAGGSVVIGEEIVYRATATLAELSMVATMSMTFPEALIIRSTYVVSVGSSIVSHNEPTNGTIGANVVTWAFGELVNTFDNTNAASDTIVIEAIAQVADLASSMVGQVFTVSSTLGVESITVTQTAAVTIVGPRFRIVDPVVLSPFNSDFDGGDVINYTATVESFGGSNSAAYDVTVSAVIPATLEVLTVAGEVADWNITSGQQVEWAVAKVDDDSTYTISFTARVLSTMRAHTNDARCVVSLVYDTYPGSLDGVTGQVTTDSRNSSNLPFKDETLAFELATSSLPDTISNNVVIGEEITLRATATLAELSMVTAISVTLPAGLVVLSTAVVSVGGNIDGSILAAAATGTVAAQVVTFEFGNIVNNYDNAASSDDILVVEVVARVADVTSNTRNQVLTTTAALVCESITSTQDVSVTVEKAEFQVSAISFIPSSTTAVDAGDVVNYTISMLPTLASNAPAYDVTVNAVVPDSLEVIQVIGGSITTVATATWTMAQLVRQDDAYTVSFGVRVRNTMRPHTPDVSCNVTLVYDSYPGAGGQSETATLSSDFLLLKSEALLLEVSSTSLADTASADVVIGEQITYRATATLAELSMGATIRMAFPTGLSIVSTNVAFIGSSIVDHDLSTGGSGTIDGTGNVASFAFGELVNAFDNIDNASDTIVVEVIAQVADIEGNGRGTVRTVSSSLIVESTTTTRSTDVTVLDNNFFVSTNAADPVTPVDAGDIISYTITVESCCGSNADAYDTTLTATVPATLQVLAVVSGAGSNIISGQELQWTSAKIDTGSTYTVEFTAQVLNTMQPHTADVICSANLAYDTYPGAGGEAKVSVLTSNALRIKNATLNLAIASTSLADTTSGTVVIGEEIVYRVTATLAELSMDAVIAVTFPTGLTVLSSTVASVGDHINGCGSRCETGGNGTVALQVVTFDFGTFANEFDNTDDSNDTLVVEVVAQVANIETNSRGASLTVSATLVVDAVPVVDTAGVTVVEAAYQIGTVQFSPSTAFDAGDNVTYTAVVNPTSVSNAPAYDVTLSAVIPATLEVLEVVGGVADASINPQQVDWTVRKIDSDYTVSFIARVLNTMRPHTIDATCTATLAYDSYPGTGGVSTLTSVTSGAIAIRNETLSFGVATTSLADTAMTSVVIGEDITYQANATLAELSMGASIAITLPASLTVVSTSVVAVGESIVGADLAVSGAGSVVATDINGGSYNVVTFDFGEFVNRFDNHDNGSDVLVVEVIAQVADVAFNARGIVLRTSAALTVESTTATLTADVTILETAQQITSVGFSNAVDPVDAGDVVTCTAVVEPTSVSNAPAYDVVLDAVIPDTLQVIEVVAGVSDSTASNHSIQWVVARLGLGTTYTVSFTALVLNSIRPNAADVYCNVSLAYDTSPGTLWGLPGRDFSDNAATATLAIKPILSELTLVYTSLGDSAIGLASVGEVLEFQVTITLAELSTDLIADVLIPTGMTVLTAEVVSVGGQISNSAIAAGQDVDFFAGSEAQTVEFAFTIFGSIINSFTNQEEESEDDIVLKVGVVVADIAAVVQGGQLSVEALVTADGVAGSALGPITTTVVEPILFARVYPEAFGSSVDAGDAIVYHIEANHTQASNSAAYFINLTATVGTYLNIVNFTFGFPPAIAVDVSDDLKEISWLVPTLTVAQRGFRATFTAEVTSLVFSNTPGVNVNSSGIYMTSSDLSLARELSFIAESDDVVIDEVALGISLTETSDDLTVGTDLAIGEAGFVVISAQLPEVTSQIVLTLHYNSSRFQVTQTTASYVGGVIACEIGSPSFELKESTQTIGYQAVKYDFGVCQNAADNAETDADRIQIFLTVIPLDAAGNFDGADVNLISELQYTIDRDGTLGSSTETLVLAIVEPDFDLTAVQPSTDPYIKALQEIAWQLNVSSSFGRDVVFTIELPAYMYYNATTSPGFTPLITQVSAGGAGNAQTLTLSFGTISTNESISFTIITTAYADMEPGYAYPTVSVDMVWTTAISNGRAGAASAAYGQIFVADIQSFSELASNVNQTRFSNFTMDESIFVDIGLYFRGSFPLVIYITPPKTNDGQLIASVQTVELIVGTHVTATGVPEGQTQIEPTVTLDPNTSLTIIDFGLLALSNVAVGNITSDDLVQLTCRFLVEQLSPWNVAGLESSIDTQVDYAGFTVTDTLGMKLLEPSLDFAAATNTSIVDPIEAGTVVLFNFSIYADHGPDRAPAYDIRIIVDVGDFLPTSYELVNSSHEGSVVSDSATHVIISLTMLEPGETWAVRFTLEAGGALPAGATSAVTISPVFDSFPGIDDRLNAGREYSTAPAHYVATFAVKPFALSISRTGSSFHADGELTIGGDMVFEVDFVLPYAALYDTALTFALPVAPGGVYSLVATAPVRLDSLNASADVSVESFDVTMNSTTFVIIDLGLVQRSLADNGTGRVRVALAVHVADSSMNSAMDLTSHYVSADLTSANFNVSTSTVAAGYVIVEPQLVHSLGVRPNTTVDAGDTVYAHHMIAHDDFSTSAGYTLDMTVTFPDHVHLSTSNIWYRVMTEADVAAWQEGCDMPADVSCFGTDVSGSVTMNGSTSHLNLGQILRGEVLVVTYAAQIQQTVGPGDSLDLQAGLAWASRPDCVGACTGVPRVYTTPSSSGALVATDVTVPVLSLASMTGVGTAVPPQAAQTEQFGVILSITFPESTSDIVTLDVMLPVAGDGTAAMHLIDVTPPTVDSSLAIDYHDSSYGSTQHNRTTYTAASSDTFRLIFRAVNTFDNLVTAGDTMQVRFTVAVKENPALVSGFNAVMFSTVSAGGAQQTGSLSITIVAPVLTTDFLITPNLGMTDLMADGNNEVWFNVTIIHGPTSLRQAESVSIDIELSGAAQFFIIDSPNFVPRYRRQIPDGSNASNLSSTAPSSAPPIQYYTESVTRSEPLLLSESIALQVGVRIEGGVLPDTGICFVANVSYQAPAAGGSAADPQHHHEGTACWYWTHHPTASPTGAPTMVPTFGLGSSGAQESDGAAMFGAIFGSIAAVLIIAVVLIAFVAAKRKEKAAASAGVKITGNKLAFPSISSRPDQNPEVGDDSIYAIPRSGSYDMGDNCNNAGEYTLTGNADGVYAEAAPPAEGVYADNENPEIYDNRARKASAVYGIKEEDGDVYEMADLKSGPDPAYAMGAAGDSDYAIGAADDGTYAVGDDGLGSDRGEDIYANDCDADNDNIYGMAVRKESADAIYGLEGAPQKNAVRQVDSVYGNAKSETGSETDDAVYGLAETSFTGMVAQDAGQREDIYDNPSARRRRSEQAEDDYGNRADVRMTRRLSIESNSSIGSSHNAIYGLYGAGQDTLERAAFNEMLGEIEPDSTLMGADLVIPTKSVSAVSPTLDRRESFQEPGSLEMGRELGADSAGVKKSKLDSLIADLIAADTDEGDQRITTSAIEEDIEEVDEDDALGRDGYLEMPLASLQRRSSAVSAAGAIAVDVQPTGAPDVGTAGPSMCLDASSPNPKKKNTSL